MVVFTDFFREHSLYDEYISNLKTSNRYLVKQLHPSLFIIKAFTWTFTSKGFDVWDNLNNNWSIACKNIGNNSIVFDNSRPKVITW